MENFTSCPDPDLSISSCSDWLALACSLLSTSRWFCGAAGPSVTQTWWSLSCRGSSRRVLGPRLWPSCLPAGLIGWFEATFEVVPDIVVEVLSTDRRRDLVRKRQLYAEAGVLEYWIVDPRNDTVTLLELHDKEYTERAALTAADTLTSPLLPGLAIPLNDVFQHRQRPADD